MEVNLNAEGSQQKVLTTLDSLIHDAERQIDSAKKRISALKQTIKSLRQIRDSGQPWPGDKAKSISIAMSSTTVFRTVPTVMF
jgi:hypothetical protein